MSGAAQPGGRVAGGSRPPGKRPSGSRPPRRLAAAGALAAAVAACSGPAPEPPPEAPRPSILLVTLDTTRADRVGAEAAAGATPALTALAARGRWFSHAYATAPTTLPAHASMLTGLVPAEHGLHENGRRLADGHPLAAERLGAAGYHTAAFVSGFPLDRRFGLARGFDRYDDQMDEGGAERGAAETTRRALAWLEGEARRPAFLWVHYFDPHDPYEPPEPFRSRFADDPYQGEIAAMDDAVGRLLAGFERFAGGGHRILVAGDHGEGLGEHGEALHGNLLYQGTMRVPLVIAGDGVEPARVDHPVSARRVYDTLLAWTGQGAGGLLDAPPETVVGEAMKPHLQYGWQPQVMAVRGRIKVIRSGEIEVYDVVADPAESDDLAGRLTVEPAIKRALAGYPLPGEQAVAPAAGADREAAERLAALGYIDWGAPQPRRTDAPSPRAMTHLFAELDRASGLFSRGDYRRAIPVLARILEHDPGNLGACLRLAAAHSLVGESRQALAWFERAAAIAPDSLDRLHYLALHHLREDDIEAAEPLLERVLAATPDRLTALEAMDRIRERQGRPAEAAAYLERVIRLRRPSAAELERLGGLRMATADTAGAIRAFERARELAGEEFGSYLELGVCYLADRRFAEARDALDRVPPSHPGYPMALFKRAQVSVLLGEPDRAERIRRARELANETTRALIAGERLFADTGAG